MTKLVNRAKMSTATTGTGAITLGTAEDGYQSFADAGVADGDVVRYVIEDGSDWEIGTGTYTASGTTLTRTVAESSNADAALNLTGSAVVYVSATDADFREETVGDITGAATLDLTTGNVFSYTPTENTTFVFSNPPASGTAYGFTLKVTGADVVSGYDLANASYDSVSFSVAGQVSDGRGPVFSPDGSKMYVSGGAAKVVYQYSLSTAWDLSTASYASLSSPAAVQSGSVQGVQFKSDGTKMYLFHGGTSIGGDGAVYQYSLSTPWDVSTASYDSVSLTITAFSFNGAFFMTQDGLRLYTIGSGDDVSQYNLSSAWDLSTATYTAQKSDLFKAEETSPYGLFLSPLGDKIFIVGSSSDIAAQGTLSTPFDITTATTDLTTFSVAAQDTTPYGLFFKPDGTKMYVIGVSSDTIYQYTTSSSAPATFTYPASVDWPAATAPDAPADGETDVLVFYTEDGGTTYYGFQAGDAMA